MYFKRAQDKESTQKHWGYHLILDCAEANDNIKDKDMILEFNRALVKGINMTPVGEPTLEYLLEDQPNAGYSLLQLIVTSNLAFHFVEKNNSFYGDIFSCKEFDPKTAIKIVKEFFGPKKMRKHFIIRDATTIEVVQQ